MPFLKMFNKEILLFIFGGGVPEAWSASVLADRGRREEVVLDGKRPDGRRLDVELRGTSNTCGSEGLRGGSSSPPASVTG